MSLANGRPYLAIPGPSTMPDRVLGAMHRAAPNIYEGALIDETAQIVADLKRVAQCSSHVAMYIGNGHAAWEAVNTNLFSKGDKVLMLATGRFGINWARGLTGLGVDVEVLDFGLKSPADPAALEARLKADSGHEIKAVLVCQTDTASSIRSDVPALRAAMDAARHPALFAVDCIASLGCDPFYFDDWGVDVMVSASQKGLMMPPGLGFVAVNAQAMAWSAQHADPRFYWDWQRRQSTNQSAKFCGTPPLAHIAGLETAIALLEEEGLPHVWARHRRLAGAVHAAVERWAVPGALRFHARRPETRSASVTAIEVASGIDPEALRTVARERFQVAMAGGLGPLAGRVFRIGHLGDMNEPMILGALAGIEAAMTVQKIPFGTDGVAAAVAYLAAQT